VLGVVVVVVLNSAVFVLLPDRALKATSAEYAAGTAGVKCALQKQQPLPAPEDRVQPELPPQLTSSS
jgi:hypothetical protein